MYHTGFTNSTTNVATAGAYQTVFGGINNDAYLSKFSSTGSLLWATYFGGERSDAGNSIATDSFGNVFLVGTTSSDTAIAVANAHQVTRGGLQDAFLARFTAAGLLKWATYYGGEFNDHGSGVAVDRFGNIYITGDTQSDTSIASAGAYKQTFGGSYDGYLVKFDTSGTRIWATYYGGSSTDVAYNVATDYLGNVYIAGNSSSSTGIATVGAYQQTKSTSSDAFLAKFSGSGSLLWGTYHGGNSGDIATALTVDSAGIVYTTGYTASTSGLATAGSYQSTNAGGMYDAFLSKFNTGGMLQWATYLGGNDTDQGYGVAIDSAGTPYIIGWTISTSGISTPGSHQPLHGGNGDAFLARFSATGSRLWATYLGGNGVDMGFYAAGDGAGNIFVSGRSSSSTGIATANSYKPLGDGNDAFLAKFTNCINPVAGVITGASSVCSDDAITLSNTVPGGIWSSNDTSIAKINSLGVVTGVMPGNAIITYYVTNGCGSADTTLSMAVHPPVFTTISKVVCAGDNFEGYSVTGSYIDTFTAANGCDSIRTLHLSVSLPLTGNVFQSICQGQSYEGYSSTGTYIDTFSTSGAGCDSIRTLVLTMLNHVSSISTQTICAGNSYMGYSTSGTYIDTFAAANGCDSIHTLNLTVRPQNTSTITRSICQGQSFEGYSASGSYSDVFADANGCDSIRMLNLTVSTAIITSESITICFGESYMGHTATGVYRDTMLSSGGCDSIHRLGLTVAAPNLTTITDTICEGASFEGYTTTGTFIDTLTDIDGCDSIRILNLAVSSRQTASIAVTICDGERYFAGGAYQTAPGTYSDTLIAQNGCDSVLTTTLLTNPSPALPVIIKEGDFLSISPSEQVDYQWYLNDSIINNSNTHTIAVTGNGVYVVSVSNQFNCTVSDTIIITGVGVDMIAIDSIDLYPNPTTGEVIISGVTPAKIRVINAQGQTVAAFSNTSTISLAGLANGIYLIQLLDGNDKWIAGKRIVKQD